MRAALRRARPRHPLLQAPPAGAALAAARPAAQRRRSGDSAPATAAGGILWALSSFAAGLLAAAAASSCGESARAEDAGGCTEGSSPRRRKSRREALHNQIPTSWRKYTIGEVIDVTHDTRILRFLLPDPEAEYGTWPTDTLQIAVWDWNFGELITRHYTPISPNGTKGHFDIMVKLYRRGLVTPQLWKLKTGDTCEIRRQVAKFHYQANKWRTFNMLAGGVGITPMLQVIRHALSDDEDTTRLNLLFCNRTPRDIILRDELDELERRHPDRFRVTYMVDRAEPGWEGPTGYVNEAALRRYFPRPHPDGRHFLVLCGPDGMLTAVGGVPRNHLTSWSHTLTTGRQPSFPDANDMAPVGGSLGNAGWGNNSVYIF